MEKVEGQKMDFFIWFIAYVLMLYAGSEIGRAKGRGSTGFVLVLLLGPLGLALIICLSNLKEEEKRRDKESRLLAARIAAQQRSVAVPFDSMATYIPPPPGSEPKIRVASNGEDLGELRISEVKSMLQSGKLTTSDFYFDLDALDWLTLDCCPKI